MASSQKAIIHILTKIRMKSDLFGAEIDSMEELYEKHGVKNIIFYKGEQIEYIDLVAKLEKFWIVFCNYSNKEELKEKALEYAKEYDIINVSSPMELLVNVMNEVKEALGHPLSDDPDVFRDKYLQRQMIRDHNPELGIKYVQWAPEDLQIEELEEKVGYPFIIKPVDGVQSSGVGKINNRADFEDYMSHYEVFHERLKSRGVDNKMLIVEEFIDGKMYSVDYYVDFEGNVLMSKPVKVKLGVDIGVDDYCNIARICTEKTQNEFKGKRLKTFINSTVKATGIRNTFVHHEIKINSKGEFKTIELNGRIGWGRLEVMKKAFDLNLYELIVNPETKPGVLKQNNIAVNIYATQSGILTEFNEKLLEKISKRETVYEVETDESAIWKEIGLTKDGFVKVGVIKLQDKDYAKVRKDFLYIIKNYKKLLDIELPLIDNSKRIPAFEAVKHS